MSQCHKISCISSHGGLSNGFLHQFLCILFEFKDNDLLYISSTSNKFFLIFFFNWDVKVKCIEKSFWKSKLIFLGIFLSFSRNKATKCNITIWRKCLKITPREPQMDMQERKWGKIGNYKLITKAIRLIQLNVHSVTNFN